jgi:hypothetical protein
MAKTSDGVDVTITSSDAAARRRIVELAAQQSALGGPLWPAPLHSGLHGGPGTIGRCPVIHADTTVTYELVPDGVRIHVAARSSSAVTKLQHATEARVRMLAVPTS